MKVNRKFRGAVVATVAALAVGAPAASAVPLYDGHPPAKTGEAYDVNRVTGAYTPANPSADMHASTVGAVKDTTTLIAGDLRTEGAKSPLQSTLVSDDLPGGGDLRSELAKHPGEPTPPPGMPTWPTDPKPIVPPASQPVAATDGGDGGSNDWPLAGLIAGAAIALLGAGLMAGRQLRGTPAH